MDLGQRVKKESQEGNILAETTSCQTMWEACFQKKCLTSLDYKLHVGNNRFYLIHHCLSCISRNNAQHMISDW